MELRYIFVMDYVDELCSNVCCEAYIVMYPRENRFYHLFSPVSNKCFKTCFAERQLHENEAKS